MGPALWRAESAAISSMCGHEGYPPVGRKRIPEGSKATPVGGAALARRRQAVEVTDG